MVRDKFGWTHIVLSAIEVGVHYPILELWILIGRIEDLKDISSHQLIITIDQHEYIIRFTIVISSIADIVCGILLLFIVDVGYPILWKFIDSLYVLLCFLKGFITWMIINEDDMIVLVFLIEHCVQYLLIPTVWNVIKARNDNA